jgi:hypothetical protein
LNGSPALINDLNNKIRDSIQYARKDDFKFPPKEYPSELKPLFSSFGLENFSVVTLRSFLLYYLPLIQPQPHNDDEDDDDLFQDDFFCACHPCAGAMLIFSVSFQFYWMSPKRMFQDDLEEKHVDLVTPFYSSVKQIIREASSLI